MNKQALEEIIYNSTSDVKSRVGAKRIAEIVLALHTQELEKIQEKIEKEKAVIDYADMKAGSVVCSISPNWNHGLNRAIAIVEESK